MNLSDILDHPTLFATAPHLGKVPVEVFSTALLPAGDIVNTLDGVIRLAGDADKDELKAALMREVERLAAEEEATACTTQNREANSPAVTAAIMPVIPYRFLTSWREFVP